MKDRDKIYLEKRKTISLVYTDREKRGKKGEGKNTEGENNFAQVSYFSDISFFLPFICGVQTTADTENICIQRFFER